MIDKADHIAWTAAAVAVFQRHCGTGDEHAIADLICDLGHLAEERGFDFISELQRGVGRWYAEHPLLPAIISGRTLPWRSLSHRGRRLAREYLTRHTGFLPPATLGSGAKRH